MSLAEQNATYWNDLCGSWIAQSLGITDSSPPSLRRYDDWYLGLYPYLLKHTPLSEMRGKKVLEVGLGYGTLSQKMIEAGAIFTGLDIAPNSVAMINDRIKQTANAKGKAIQGTILDAPLASESFDFVVAIGSLHHTGDLAKSVNECFRLLRPDGKFVFMVYNSLSYRRFWQEPKATFKLWRDEKRQSYKVSQLTRDSDRFTYDSNSTGIAPHIDTISRDGLRRLCSRFKSFSASLENITTDGPFSFKPCSREFLLRTPIPRFFGLDIYATAIK